jgi:hypothetical protein
LPHLQKLCEKVKDRNDIQIISFNVDDNIGILGPFIKEKGLTFPVIPASRLMKDLVPMLGIPLNWIVDSDGTVRFESVGFGGNGDKWAEQLMAAIDRLLAGT